MIKQIYSIFILAVFVEATSSSCDSLCNRGGAVREKRTDVLHTRCLVALRNQCNVILAVLVAARVYEMSWEALESAQKRKRIPAVVEWMRGSQTL